MRLQDALQESEISVKELTDPERLDVGAWQTIYDVGDEEEFNKVAEKVGSKYDELRFIAGAKGKNLFVFSPTLTHTLASEKLEKRIGGDINKTPDPVIAGFATKTGDRWSTQKAYNLDMAAQAFRNRMLGIEERREDAVQRYLSTVRADWSWLDKYIDTTPFVKKLQSTTKKSITWATA